jgi:hypothetical protein
VVWVKGGNCHPIAIQWQLEIWLEPAGQLVCFCNMQLWQPCRLMILLLCVAQYLKCRQSLQLSTITVANGALS